MSRRPEQAEREDTRAVRRAQLLCLFGDELNRLHAVEGTQSYEVGDLHKAVLLAATEWTSAESLLDRFAPHSPQRVRATIEELVDCGLLRTAEQCDHPLASDWRTLAFHRAHSGTEPLSSSPIHAFEGAEIHQFPSVDAAAASLSGSNLLDVLRERRSIRRFAAEPISRSDLGCWLRWSTRGPSPSHGAVQQRAHPVAGGEPCLSVYLQIKRAQSIRPGLYRYLEFNHSLERTADTSTEEFVEQVLGGEDWLNGAAVIAMIAADVTLRARTYRNAYKLALLEAGHLLQNMSLVATHVGLGSCEYGEVAEDPILPVLKARREVPLAIIAIGVRALDVGAPGLQSETTSGRTSP
jgi:SagB-type dehydrogenase family enzyme